MEAVEAQAGNVGVLRAAGRDRPRNENNMRRALVTSEFYAPPDRPKASVPGHSKTCAIKADIYKYLMRSL